MNTALAAPPLDERLVFEWLRHRGLIEAADVVRGQVTITPRHSRNANFAVLSGTNGYFVKQAERIDPPGSPSVFTETKVLSMIATQPAFDLLRSAVPRIVRSSQDQSTLHLNNTAASNPSFMDVSGVLVTELLEGDNLRTALHRLAARAMPNKVADNAGKFDPGTTAAALGGAIATLHATPIDALQQLDVEGGIRRAVPWFLTIATVTDPQLGGTGDQIRSIVREHGLVDPLAELVEDWQANAFTHGDIKGENVMLTPNGPVITDWETADVGDRDWDVAGLLHSCLALWVVSMPQDSALDGAALSAAASLDLDAMKPFLRRFWSEYAAALEITGDDRVHLERVARFTAARLVQAAAEYSQNELSIAATRLLQIARITFDEPLEMLDELLGIAA